jgi:hypothetical protein
MVAEVVRSSRNRRRDMNILRMPLQIWIGICSSKKRRPGIEREFYG